MSETNGHVQPSARPRSASVVINNYNYGRFLPAAIRSALGQTHPTQVIVVDDGSTDGSQAIIESFGDRIRKVLQANRGQGSAMNAGFALATGDVVIFLDSDDELHENAVASVLAAWREDTVMAHYRMDMIDVEGRPRGGIHPPPWRPLADGDIREELLRTGSFATTVTSGLAFSRKALNSIMPIPETRFKMAADGYLVRAVALQGPVQAIERSLAKYRRHDTNDSALSAYAANPALFYRKKISYLQNEHEIVRSFAQALGLSVAKDLGESDFEYLACRLYSIALDPEAHPVEQDRQADLLLRYLVHRYNQSDPLLARVADAVTALGVTLLPREAGKDLVRWRQVHATRPWWLKQLATTYRDARAILRPGAD